MKSIRVQTQSKTDKIHENHKAITAKHWKIYYQLMSVSKYNAQAREDHRYVYKNTLNIAKLCRENGIKSTKTFYNAIERLSEWHLIIDNPTYFMLYAPNWIEITPYVLSTLLAHTGNDSQHIDVLRIFLILKKMDKYAEMPEDRNFTIRGIVQLLSHGTTHASSYENVRFYLGILSYWKLIELKVHTEYQPNLGAYKVYQLQWVSEENLSPDFDITSQAAEEQAPLISDKMREKLSFSFPAIVGDLKEKVS